MFDLATSSTASERNNMTTTTNLANIPHPVDPPGEQLERYQHMANGEIRTIRCLMNMYPSNTWTWEEALVVKAAMSEIAVWRQKGIRLEGLEKAGADIANRERMRAVTIAENHARWRAAAAPCDLCDEEGRVLGRDGKQVHDADGYDLDCRHGRPVDLDDDED
jgi:hypothetical protein